MNFFNNSKHTQIQFISSLILLSSLIPYLNWGGENHAFLFQIEWEIIKKLCSDPAQVIHPLIIIPVLSQVIIITFGLFIPKVRPVFIGIIGLFLLFIFIFLGGFLSANLWMILSGVPFVISSILFILVVKTSR